MEGSTKQSICYGHQNWSVQDVLNKSKKDRRYTFENPRIYDECCAVLWLGDTMEAFFSGKRNKASILVFGLDGKGVAKFDFDFMITHFDLDPQEERLYVRDDEGGNIYAYDCKI